MLSRGMIKTITLCFTLVFSFPFSMAEICSTKDIGNLRCCDVTCPAGQEPFCVLLCSFNKPTETGCQNCSEDRFSGYRTDPSKRCVLKRSCDRQGMIYISHGSSTRDATCGCKHGYNYLPKSDKCEQISKQNETTPVGLSTTTEIYTSKDAIKGADLGMIFGIILGVTTALIIAIEVIFICYRCHRIATSGKEPNGDDLPIPVSSMMLPSDVENQNSLSLAVDEPRFVTIQDDQIPQPQVATEPTTLVSDEDSGSTSTQCPDFQDVVKGRPTALTDELVKKILQSSDFRPDLLQSIEINEVMLACLTDYISKYDKDELLNEFLNRQRKMERLLTIIENNGMHAFLAFTNALFRCKQIRMLKMLITGLENLGLDTSLEEGIPRIGEKCVDHNNPTLPHEERRETSEAEH